MRLQHDCYCLALEMLSGGRDTRRVLADLLEDQGDRELVRRARSTKWNERAAFDLALGLIPCRLLLPLACDFMRHAVTCHPAVYASPEPLLEVLEALRRQQWDQPEPTLLRTTCCRLERVAIHHVATTTAVRYWQRPWPLGLACVSLARAARSAAQAAVSGDVGPWQVRFHEDGARAQARQAAKHARQDAGCRLDEWRTRHNWQGRRMTSVPKLFHDPAVRAAELDWQAERTRWILEQLIHSESPADIFASDFGCAAVRRPQST